MKDFSQWFFIAATAIFVSKIFSLSKIRIGVIESQVDIFIGSFSSETSMENFLVYKGIELIFHWYISNDKTNWATLTSNCRRTYFYE